MTLITGAAARAPNISAVRADLAAPETLPAAVSGVDVVVHFAGVLFAPGPERFLPVTNTRFFSNLLAAALGAGVRKMILISFPHVEGPTSVDAPATGRLDRTPVSVHAQTRLQEERLLFERTGGTGCTPVVLRLGMVYGRGILMVDAARWLARRRLLAVWPEPTWIQLISTIDYLRAPRRRSWGLVSRASTSSGTSSPSPSSTSWTRRAACGAIPAPAGCPCGSSRPRPACASGTPGWRNPGPAHPRFRPHRPRLLLGRHAPREAGTGSPPGVPHAGVRAFDVVNLGPIRQEAGHHCPEKETRVGSGQGRHQEAEGMTKLERVIRRVSDLRDFCLRLRAGKEGPRKGADGAAQVRKATRRHVATKSGNGA